MSSPSKPPLLPFLQSYLGALSGLSSLPAPDLIAVFEAEGERSEPPFTTRQNILGHLQEVLPFSLPSHSTSQPADIRVAHPLPSIVCELLVLLPGLVALFSLLMSVDLLEDEMTKGCQADGSVRTLDPDRLENSFLLVPNCSCFVIGVHADQTRRRNLLV